MPRSVDPDQKRSEFVAASWDVIAREGLKGATLRRVAEAAGCTTGSLTHYYPDRAALLVDALRAAHRQAGERMLGAFQRCAHPRERLEAVVRESLPLDATRLREWRVWLAFWAESMHDEALGAENARGYDEWQALLGELLQPLVRGDQELAAEVDHLLVLLDGLGLRLCRQPAGSRPSRRLRRATEATLALHLARFGSSEPR